MTSRQVTKSIVCILFAFTTLVVVTPVYAVSQPSFFSCLNPQGDLQVTHTDGLHGVPGMQPDKPGVDKVYSESAQDTLSSSTVVQCLCPDNGQGIQTNWWKASDLSEEEIKVLEAQGWIYVPEGSAWGLESTPYMAQNVNFACNASNQATSNSTSGGTNTNNNGSNNSSNNNSNNSSSSTSPTQSVLGAITELANTGNIIFLYTLLGIGIVTSGIALALRKNK